MLTQNVQQGESSELISKELMEKFHNFLSHFYVALGHTKGETKLPEPSDEIFRNPNINDNEKTQICEGAVVMWIDLIRYILKQEPEHEFRNNGNPLPSSEIDFWKNKSTALNSILFQIEGKKITEILKFLEKQKSTYHKMFNEIRKDVEEKGKESYHNYKYLQCLEKEFNMLGDETKELTEVVDEFVPIFHIIREIWRDNEYYKKPERLIVLIRKICNAIIAKGQEFIHSNIFNKILDDPEKEIQVLEQTREIIQKFMKAYFQYKDIEEDGWKITRNVIFYRLDAFNDRVGDILNVARSYNEFSKMSTKTIGGIKGEALGQSLLDIYNECTAAVKDFISDEYDPLDINDDTFNVKYAKFKDILKELERKISAVLTQTFDENDTIMGKFKVLDNFDTILERPYIVVELEKKYNILLDLYKDELREVQNLFLTGKKQIENNDEKNPLNKNMPPIAALLNWTDSLKSRITEPIEKFRSCGKRITEKEEFGEIENSYNSIYNMINEYGNTRKADWDEKAKTDSVEKQKIYILVKKDNLLNVNFDPDLSQLLKEVKYLKILNMEIPQEAEDAFAKNSKFRKQISNLENIKAQYNSIILQLNEVEKPMVEWKLNKVEEALLPALNEYTWEDSKKIDDFTTKAHKIISELADTVNKLKLFVAKIDAIFKEWLLPESMLFQKPKEISEADAVSTRFIAYYEQERAKMATRVKDISNLGEVQIALKQAVQNLHSFEWFNRFDISKLVTLEQLFRSLFTAFLFGQVVIRG
jgi:dynein heavy chain